MDYKLEALKNKAQLSRIILKDHGELCRCSECFKAEEDLIRLKKYQELKQKMEEI